MCSANLSLPTAHYPTTINSLERSSYEIRADAADFLFGCLLVVYVAYLIVFLLSHFAIVSSLLYVYFNFNTIYIEREKERRNLSVLEIKGSNLK